MKRFIFKVSATLTTGALVAGFYLPGAAFADTTVNVVDNGPDSYNSVHVTNNNSVSLNQSANTSVETVANVIANSGGVEANKNNGDVDITTGNATANVSNVVTGGSNIASLNQCGCENDTSVTVDHNGTDSVNKVKVTNANGGKFKQKSNLSVATVVNVKAKTGKVKTNKNNYDVTVTTGDASSSFDQTVDGGANILNP